MGSLVASLVALVSLATAQEPRWTVQCLDPFGAVPYSYALPRVLSTAQTDALADLKAGKSDRAWGGFKALYLEDDAAPLHIWGLMLAGQESGRLREGIELVASRVQAMRERDLAKGNLAPTRANGSHLAAFCLGLAMASYHQAKLRPLGPLSDRWLATLISQALPSSTKDKGTIILYSTAMHVLMAPSKARPPLASLVSRIPNDARLHYLMSRLYSEGVVKLIERGGREVPVPPGDRINKPSAIRHALLAAELEPTWAGARYQAGLMLVVDDVRVAKEHFRAYLKLATPSAKRKAIIDRFLATGHWGPPPVTRSPLRELEPHDG